MANIPDEGGLFPFGCRNAVRPPAVGAHRAAMVVGVYPSAFHVSWRPPAFIRGPRRGVAAMAVDVEPRVFWDGDTPSADELLARWLNKVQFRAGDHGGADGHVVPASANGASGMIVVERYLKPLGLDPAKVSFTDIWPRFMTKAGTTKARGQAEAIQEEYNEIASTLKRQPATLPKRLSERTLPEAAVASFGHDLITLIEQVKPSLLISLGRETWTFLKLHPHISAEHPGDDFADLGGARYGSVGRITVGSASHDWLPMVHPGLLRGSRNSWTQLHQRWEEQHSG